MWRIEYFFGNFKTLRVNDHSIWRSFIYALAFTTDGIRCDPDSILEQAIRVLEEEGDR